MRKKPVLLSVGEIASEFSDVVGVQGKKALVIQDSRGEPFDPNLQPELVRALAACMERYVTTPEKTAQAMASAVAALIILNDKIAESDEDLYVSGPLFKAVTRIISGYHNFGTVPDLDDWVGEE